IYKPSGRLSFKVSVIELVGEGVIKKAYDDLKKKLKDDGLFEEARKKLIPEFPKKIGLITSETGAVIHDFSNNLGQYGYQIKFYDSRVEGQVAVRDLLRAVNYFDNQDIDVLVIIRGGGSLESLQAFNNESLVRRISNLKIPVIVGIGHDKDIPLMSLVADRTVSTPTAVTVLLNKSWDNFSNNLSIFERDLIYRYQKLLSELKYDIEELSNKLKKYSIIIFEKFEELKYSLKKALININHSMKDQKSHLEMFENSLLSIFKKALNQTKVNLNNITERLIVVDPMRQLKLGYSLVSISGQIIRSIQQVEIGDDLDIQVGDGKIISVVKSVNGLTG
ncbi:exodeoxyribonuclease VII large subunit, partial [Candidatus Azambacteria bacterium]|nr:exodeoxyribonuclease VII large subunit [Candidatus Azambacteria bacterium]